MEMEHKWIESEKGIVHYWIHNKNTNQKCIVFTHGLTADHSMFEKQIDFFAKDYTVITWDVPLHGKSRPYADFSYYNTAIELKNILDMEQMEKVVLVGMSMGGYPCQEFARLYPKRVEGLIGLDTTPFGKEFYSKSDLWWLKQVAPLARCFPEQLLRNSMAKSVSKTEYSYKKMMDMLTPHSKVEIIEQMEIAYGVFAKENKDVSFHFPILLLLGEHDTTGKVRYYNELWTKKEGYPLHIIKNAAHFSNGDNPEQVNAEIKAFLEELGFI